MYKILLTAAITILTTGAFAQSKLPYKPSGEVLEAMTEAIENEKYEQAVKKGLRIHEGDTNYLDAQFQIVYAHFKNEKYGNVIEVASKHIDDRNGYTYLFYLYLGRAYLEKEQFDIAIDIFSTGLDLFPKYAKLYKYRSFAYFKLKQSTEGLEDLKMAIKLNPWDAENHKTLGELAENEGENSKAFICYISHLLLQPDDNLKFLSEVNDKLTNGFDEMPDGLEVSKDDYSDLDALIENKAAMEKSVKTTSKLSLPISKNCQLIFDKLGERELKDGFFDTFYAPFYIQLQKQASKSRRYFDYLILYSSENSKVASKVRAYNYQIGTYYKNSLMPLWKTEHSKYTEEYNGKVQEVYYGWYNTSLNSIGKKINDDPIGDYTYYYSNGQLRAVGTYDEVGERDKKWTFYHLNGQISGIEEYKDGKLINNDSSFYDNGVLRSVDVIDSENNKSVMSRFNFYGVPTSVISYSDDERDGPATFYNNFGTEEYSVEFIKGKLDGPYKEYYNNKQITEEVTFEDGSRSGIAKKYYKNGQLRSEFNYVEGKKDGDFKEYYITGEIKTEGTYKAGTLINQYKSFHSNGSLSSEAFYDEKGKKNGIYKEYDRSGKLNLELTFKKGEFVAYKVYHKDGSLIKEGSKKGGEFLFENFYSDGTKRAVGNYIGEEGKSGLWKFYDRNGVLDEEETYTAGLLNGKNISFYYNGKKHFTKTYQEGKVNGLYVRYYLNGQISRQGYSFEGKDQGKWLYYNSNGSISAEKFFVNDKLNGPQKYFDVNNKLSSIDYYDMGVLTRFETYDTTGKVMDVIAVVKDSTEIEIHGIDGAVLRNYTRVNGIKHGVNTSYYGNGEIYSTGKYVEGSKHGAWKGFHENGKPRYVGTYFYGTLVGDWKYYDTKGKIETETTYENGAINGEKKWYVNGNISTVRTYEKGSAHGNAYYYSDLGELQYVRKYYYGKVVAYSYPGTDGELVEFIPVKNESCDCKSYFANGKVSREFTMDRGYFEGEYKEYYENGQLNNINYYKGGDLNGVTTNYYPSGATKYTISYVDDEIDGAYTKYYENGKISEITIYVNGTKHGISKRFNEAGKLIETVNYYDGDIIK